MPVWQMLSSADQLVQNLKGASPIQTVLQELEMVISKLHDQEWEPIQRLEMVVEYWNEEQEVAELSLTLGQDELGDGEEDQREGET